VTTICWTLHLWWLWAYLLIGVVLYFPLEYVAWRSLALPRNPFWIDWRLAVRLWPYAPVVSVLAWPVAVYKVIR
jgi:hypothetical protein